jgi:hypothetical protein
MAQVRALYEDTAVPVREIARRAGVTERTLYKYARKSGWTPRYAWTSDGARPAGRPQTGAARETGQQRAQRFAPVKGAGGRFVRREDAGKPFAQGIKATDPAARAAAERATAEAARRAQRAELAVDHDDVLALRSQALREVNRGLDALIAHREQWKGRAPTDYARQCESVLLQLWQEAIAWYQHAIAWERQIRETLYRFDAETAAAVTSSDAASS